MLLCTDKIISGIYVIKNAVSGRCYVGSAVNIQQRWYAHTSMLERGKHHSPALIRSWKKHGRDAFLFDVLEIVNDKADLVVREQHWIDTLHASCPRRGFNVCPASGSPRGYKHSIETRAKQSVARKGRKLPPFSAEHRQKISEARRGFKASPETCAKMSKARLGHKLGPQSEQHRKNLSAAAMSPERREKMISRNKSPEMREKVRAAKLRMYQDPERRAELKAMSEKGWVVRRASGITYKHTPETKRRLSEAKKGKMTAEHKAAIAESNRKRAQPCPSQLSS